MIAGAARTRSRPYLESSPLIKTASPLKHLQALTPGRHPVKRRRLGMSSLALSRLNLSSNRSSDSDDSEQHDDYPSKAQRLYAPSPRIPPRTRKSQAKQHASKGASCAGDDSEMSPRKRKRSDGGSIPPVESDSWVETEDEAPDFIAEDDQHLLQIASAASLHRLRKGELIRLWKVAGMWSSGEEEDMEDAEEDADHGLGKAELVSGIVAARKQFSAPASTRAKSSSLDRAFSPKELRSRTTSLTSPPSSSDESSSRRPGPMDVDATPKAPRRTRLGTHTKLGEPIALRPAHPKVRQKTKARTVKPRGKGLGRKARFGPNIKSPEHPTTALARRSSTASSAYATTTDGSEGDELSTPLKTRSLQRSRQQVLSGEAANVRSTPLVRRLRPRARGRVASSASTEVDADAEDNGDGVESGPTSSSSAPRRSKDSGKSRDQPERHAKREAMKAIRQESPASVVEDALSGDMDEEPISSPVKSGRSGRLRKSSSLSQRPHADDIDVDDEAPSSVRTTRSGKVFGDMELRDGSPIDIDDRDMDDDMGQGEEWNEEVDLTTTTLSSLTRLRRDQLVHMCEARNLEVGGTKTQLARSLIDWQSEQSDDLERTSSISSQTTARPGTPESPRVVPAVATNTHRDGQATPVLLREHIHAIDPATPPRSDEDAARSTENDLNLDLQELGLEDFTIKPKHLVKFDKIGSGGFKDVFIGKLKGRKVAISEFRGHLSEMDIRELKLLAEFSHPNIVRFRGICIPEDSSHVPCMLISELCENGDLFDYIRNVPPPPLKRVLRLMLDIARGLEYLHLRKPAIIHRDCKSTNILITRQGTAKVGDFGLARVKHSTRSMIRSLVGTVNWQAPELWHANPRYDYKVDVFSAALVFWEMLSGWAGDKKYPWEGHNEHYIYDAVGQKQRRPGVTGLRKAWGPEPVNLIERMWLQDPAERPTMSDVVADLEALITEG